MNEQDAVRALVAISRKLNFEPSADMMRITARELVRIGWTAGEMERAARIIPNDARLSKEARYSGALTSDVFAAARQDPRIIAGRTVSVYEFRDIVRKFAGGSDYRIRPVAKAFRAVRVENESWNRMHLQDPDAIINSPNYGEIIKR